MRTFLESARNSSLVLLFFCPNYYVSTGFPIDSVINFVLIQLNRFLKVHAIRTLPQGSRVSDGADGASIPDKQCRKRYP